MNALNRFLDTLPRIRFGQYTREVPAFRTCGIVGFYCALIVAMAGGLLARRSLLIVAALALTCALSFFVYAYVRRWITGHEELVLLEHVWFAEACAAAVLWLLGESVLGYLDVITPALCVFLAAGRVGCFLVGCCHGRPSSVGIAYGEGCARDGFPKHLVGVRLFPVPVIEAAGLIIIGLSGLVALPSAAEGRVFVWFLLSYAAMRFGCEDLRGDTRPHFLGLSQARWMALGEIGLALQLADEQTQSRHLLWTFLAAAVVGALVLRRVRDWRMRLLAGAHVEELRELVRELATQGSRNEAQAPDVRRTSGRVVVAVSSESLVRSGAHVSLSLLDGRKDLSLMCELAARAFPGLRPEAARFTQRSVLHLAVSTPLSTGDGASESAHLLSATLYGSAVRRLQQEAERITPNPSLSSDGSAKGDVSGPVKIVGFARPSYFYSDGAGDRHQ